MKALALCAIGVWVVLGMLNYGMALRGDPHGVLRGVNCMQWAAITYLLFRRWIAPPGERP